MHQASGFLSVVATSKDVLFRIVRSWRWGKVMSSLIRRMSVTQHSRWSTGLRI